MALWLMTTTCYGTWLPGDARGSVTSVRDTRVGEEDPIVRLEHDIPGTPFEEEIEGLARSAQELMKGPPIYFDLEKAIIILNQFRETTAYRKHKLYAVAVMYNHVHFVVEALKKYTPKRLLADYKAYGSRALNKVYGEPPSETWWTDNGSKRLLKDVDNFARAKHYVLKRQPNPLLLWSPELGLQTNLIKPEATKV